MSESENISIQKNMLWNSCGSFIYMLSQWALTIFIVRISGYEDAGNYSLAMSISNIFYGIAIYGIRNYQVSDIYHKYTSRQYIDARYITCGMAYILSMIFVGLNSYDLYKVLIILIFMVFKMHEAIIDVYHGIDQMLWRLDIAGKSYILRSFTTFFGFIGCLFFSKNLFLSILIMTICAYLCICLYDIPNVKKIEDISLDRNLKKSKQLLIECAPVVIYLFMSTCITSIPRYILEIFEGSEILGIYSSISTPAIIVQVMASYVFSPLMSLFAQSIANKDRKKCVGLFVKCLVAISVVGIVGICGAKLVGNWGLSLLFGSEILKYNYLLIPAILVSILTALVWFFNGILTVFREFKGLIIANGVGLLCNILCSVFFINKFGINGTNYALFVSMGLQIILLVKYVLMRVNLMRKMKRG